MDDQNIQPEQGQAIILANLESLIKSHIGSIEKLETALKEELGTLDNILINDPTYKKHDELAKEALKVKTATKTQILKQPSVAHTNEKIKDVRTQIKDMKSELSEYLLEYQRLANTDTIEGEDGQLRVIVNSAKLIRQSSK